MHNSKHTHVKNMEITFFEINRGEMPFYIHSLFTWEECKRIDHENYDITRQAWLKEIDPLNKWST